MTKLLCPHHEGAGSPHPIRVGRPDLWYQMALVDTMVEQSLVSSAEGTRGGVSVCGLRMGLMIGVPIHGFIFGHSMPPTLPKSPQIEYIYKNIIIIIINLSKFYNNIYIILRILSF